MLESTTSNSIPTTIFDLIKKYPIFEKLLSDEGKSPKMPTEDNEEVESNNGKIMQFKSNHTRMAY